MVAFIILNYNTWEMTIQCVDSIFKTCKLDYTIYIVDNGSNNKSYEELTKQYRNNPNVKVIKSENYGYAIGNNIGIKKAIEDGHEFVTVTNNDVIFLDNSISEMHSFLKINPNVAVTAPYILSSEGRIRDLPTLKPLSKSDYLFHNTKLNKFTSAKSKQRFDQEYYLSAISIKDDPIPIYKFSGCCFMARSVDFMKVELFDEHTFLYYEEDILSHKMYKAGLKSFFLPDAKIVHHHGQTTGKENLFVDTEMFKSEIYFLARVYQLNYLLLLLIYLDRAITPLMKKLKHAYKLSFSEYKDFLKKTWSHFRKYSKLHKD
ncbi:glycosyltransferase family 2 protein [Bacillus sp. DNRA2]|uniref:glycosyltransferase family 2 protein n=1 Tax=Bacillus sp. DNRA2 TaxID=2723053 RepID=UPI00145EB110|nr:glycosyltransferase family 2 protein [Bacillus sp. DNRA2]NMD68801.1 glycosyltransferase family 2 protein [Bacillus sp. DNRA2]